MAGTHKCAIYNTNIIVVVVDGRRYNNNDSYEKKSVIRALKSMQNMRDEQKHTNARKVPRLECAWVGAFFLFEFTERSASQACLIPVGIANDSSVRAMRRAPSVLYKGMRASNKRSL